MEEVVNCYLYEERETGDHLEQEVDVDEQPKNVATIRQIEDENCLYDRNEGHDRLQQPYRVARLYPEQIFAEKEN